MPRVQCRAAPPGPGQPEIDLDVVVFGLNAKRFLVSEDYLIYYQNRTSKDNAVKHWGDARSGPVLSIRYKAVL